MKRYGHPQFYEILDELADLHSNKNRQYATPENPLANFERCGYLAGKLFKKDIKKPLAMALCYMSKQIDGVYEIVGENKKNTIENLEDKLKDIAVYSIICIILNKSHFKTKGKIMPNGKPRSDEERRKRHKRIYGNLNNFPKKRRGMRGRKLK